MTARRTTTQRGYGAQHVNLRKQWEHRLNQGEQHNCARCNKPINPYDNWDLGHTDDRTNWTGPEHVKCNRAAGARNAVQAREAKRNITIRTW